MGEVACAAAGVRFHGPQPRPTGGSSSFLAVLAQAGG